MRPFLLHTHTCSHAPTHTLRRTLHIHTHPYAPCTHPCTQPCSQTCSHSPARTPDHTSALPVHAAVLQTLQATTAPCCFTNTRWCCSVALAHRAAPWLGCCGLLAAGGSSCGQMGPAGWWRPMLFPGCLRPAVLLASSLLWQASSTQLPPLLCRAGAFFLHMERSSGAQAARLAALGGRSGCVLLMPCNVDCLQSSQPPQPGLGLGGPVL